MKRSIARLIALSLSVLSLLTLLGGCFLLPEEEAVLAPPLVEPEEIAYRTTEVERGDLELTIRASAYFVSVSRENVFYANASGRLADWHAYLGQEVEAGDLLCELESDSIETRLRDQKISLEKQRLNLQRLKEAKPDPYAIRAAEIDLELAQMTYDDLHEQYAFLFVRNDQYPSLSQQEELDEMKLQLTKQELNLEKLKMNLEKVSKVDNSYAISVAELDYQNALNSYRDVQDELESRYLRAPVSGIVTWIRQVDVGDSISPHVTLFTISDPYNLALVYQDTKSGNFPVGLPITATVDGKKYEGKVLTNPSTNPLDESGSKQNYAAFELYEFDMSTVAEGTNASVIGVLDSRTDVIVLDKGLVNNYSGRKYVNVLEDGLKVERDVEIGLETATKVEILSGLEVGELVITN